jgi:hypothetical protein
MRFQCRPIWPGTTEPYDPRANSLTRRRSRDYSRAIPNRIFSARALPCNAAGSASAASSSRSSRDRPVTRVAARSAERSYGFASPTVRQHRRALPRACAGRLARRIHACLSCPFVSRVPPSPVMKIRTPPRPSNRSMKSNSSRGPHPRHRRKLRPDPGMASPWRSAALSCSSVQFSSASGSALHRTIVN